MKNPIVIELMFKGERTYVQGPDIYNAVMKELSTSFNMISDVSASFHNMVSSQVDCFLYESDAVTETNPDCQISFKSGEKDYTAVVKGNGNEITGRYPYPESEIVKHCMVEDNSIILEHKVGFSPLEKIVAMNKVLMNSVFNKPKGKWLFTKLTLSNQFDKENYDKYTLTLVKNIGLKLTKTAIHLDDKLVGYIFFSLV